MITNNQIKEIESLVDNMTKELFAQIFSFPTQLEYMLGYNTYCIVYLKKDKSFFNFKTPSGNFTIEKHALDKHYKIQLSLDNFNVNVEDILLLLNNTLKIINCVDPTKRDEKILSRINELKSEIKILKKSLRR